MSLYAGGYALLEGLDPYDEAVWVPLRQQLGGRWMPDPRAPFPLWTFLITAPFALLSIEWAAAAWLAVSLSLILVSAHLVLSLRPSNALSPAALLLLVFLAFFTRGGLASLNNGQLTAVLLTVLALFLFLESRGHAFAAGAAFALVALKPNPFIFFVPSVLVWLILRRRFDILLGSVATGFGLLAVTWALRPGWILDWMAVRDKTQAAIATPTVWGMAYEYTPAAWAAVGLGLTLFITVITSWYILTRPYVTLPTVTGVALSASLAITPYAWSYEQLLLIVPLLLMTITFPRRSVGLLLYFVLVIIVPWLMLAVAIQLDSDVLAFLVPLLSGMGLVAAVEAARHVYSTGAITSSQPARLKTEYPVPSG